MTVPTWPASCRGRPPRSVRELLASAPSLLLRVDHDLVPGSGTGRLQSNRVQFETCGPKRSRAGAGLAKRCRRSKRRNDGFQTGQVLVRPTPQADAAGRVGEERLLHPLQGRRRCDEGDSRAAEDQPLPRWARCRVKEGNDQGVACGKDADRGQNDENDAGGLATGSCNGQADIAEGASNGLDKSSMGKSPGRDRDRRDVLCCRPATGEVGQAVEERHPA